MSLANLNASNLQITNPAAYAAINDLIQQVTALQNLVAGYGLLIDGAGGLQMGVSSPLLLNGGQIQFPYIQRPSVNAQTLDDYQEGNWTPKDASGANLVFSTSVGNFTKIGNLVLAGFQVVYPATADATNAKIGGLPYIANGAFALWQSHFYSGVGFIIGGIMLAGTSTFVLANSAAAGAAIQNSTVSGLDIVGTLIYQSNP